MAEKIIIGMSGGVDSAVSALLLLEQGFDVEGLFMKNWDEDDTDEYCTAAEDLNDAQSVSDNLGIKLHTVNFSTEYWDRVFAYFLAEYQAGRTPNPDIMCNKEIKFKAFLDYAKTLGATAIATGHYARINRTNEKYQLLKGKDNNKDQSYFLYTLGQQQLAQSRFPLGTLEKNKVREIAVKHQFSNARKKDSTGICFIGERNFKDFLQTYLPAQPGEIITPDSVVIGEHQGLMYYTIGQRQGLGIGGLQNASEAPWYVLGKNLVDNKLIVGQGHDHPLLFKSRLRAKDLHWVAQTSIDRPFTCQAKIRYRQPDQACKVTPISENELQVTFDHPQRAVTSGQSIVFYDNEVCLGGGVIQ